MSIFLDLKPLEGGAIAFGGIDKGKITYTCKIGYLIVIVTTSDPIKL